MKVNPGMGDILIDRDGRKICDLKEIGKNFEFLAQLSKVSTFFEPAEIKHSKLIEI